MYTFSVINLPLKITNLFTYFSKLQNECMLNVSLLFISTNLK